MIALVSAAASDERRARPRTCSATTEKPASASPARAASPAALSASMWVWNAISSLTLMIFAISDERVWSHEVLALTPD